MSEQVQPNMEAAQHFVAIPEEQNPAAIDGQPTAELTRADEPSTRVGNIEKAHVMANAGNEAETFAASIRADAREAISNIGTGPASSEEFEKNSYINENFPDQGRIEYAQDQVKLSEAAAQLADNAERDAGLRYDQGQELLAKMDAKPTNESIQQ